MYDIILMYNVLTTGASIRYYVFMPMDKFEDFRSKFRLIRSRLKYNQIHLFE